MKVSKQQMAENRERILDAAARLFRERGFDGIGVADLMKAAGLTHGGFYGHFASKEDLMAQAAERAMATGLEYWKHLATTAPGAPLETAADWYLSPAHRDDCGGGCTLAALGAEAVRQGPAVRRVVTQGLEDFVQAIAITLPGTDPTERRRQALASYAAMVGALVMSRVVDDEALSAEVLDAVRERLPGR